MASASDVGRAVSRIEDLRDDLTGRPASDVLGDLAAFLEERKTFLITAHVNPDGDALGSAIALALGLRQLGKDARVFANIAPAERFAAILPTEMVEVVDNPPSFEAGTFDACVVLDTSEPERCGPLRDTVFAAGQARVCVDHHLVRGQYSYEHHLVLERAPATGCIVLALLDALGVTIDETMATALWVAISTDTGWFRFTNTDPIALGSAARLLAHGLDAESLWGAIYGAHSVARTRLLGRVLDTLRCEFDGRLIWSLASIKEMRELGVTRDELDGVVDFLKGVKDARLAALIVERGEGQWKVSLRSVSEHSVESVARDFGGGGHAKAAGYRFEGSLDELLAALRPRIAKLFSS